jgi:hypothetical protein
MRRWKRQKAGYICLVEHRDGLHGCRIMNISVAGACLVGLATSVGPGELLTVSWKGRKARRTCRVVWTDGEHVGVQFVGPPELSSRRRASAAQ